MITKLEKRILVVFMALMMCITVIPMEIVNATSTQAEDESKFEYFIQEDGTVFIDSYTGSKANVVIPKTIKGKKVTAVSMSHNDSVKSVTVPNTVTTLEYAAFAYSKNLTEIKFEENSQLKHIGAYAFMDCDSLKELIVPKGVTSLGHRSFVRCKNLKKVVIPSTVKEINSEIGYYVGEAYLGEKSYTIENVVVYGYQGSAIEKFYKTKQQGSQYATFKTIEKLALNQNSKTLNVGSTTTLKSVSAPSIPLTYSSSQTSVATVSSSGKVTAKKAGITTITAVNSYGEKATCQVTVPYTITYKLNGGTNNKSNPSSYYGKTIKLANPTRKGYTFQGWYSDSNYKTKVTSFSSGNKTLYAKWTATKYTIKYNMNGGTNNKSNPTSYYITSNTITLKNPTRKGYTFSGWYSDSKFKTKVTKIAKGSTGNKTLYAKWTATKYTIKYNMNGGTNNKSNPTSYYITSNTITLKNPTRKGYTFQGWYSDSKFKTKVTKIAKGSTGNKTLYAKWTKVSVAKAKTPTLTNVSGKKLKISYSATSGAKGYQIQYSTSKKFSNPTTKTITGKSATYTLKKGKTYYVRVRAYKLDSKGLKVYGSWSTVKSKKITK